MKVLVTGAAGFVGARLAEVLLEGGHDVCGFDAFDGEDPDGWQEARLQEAQASERLRLAKGDVTRPGEVEEAISGFRPAAVVHLASRKELGWAEENPETCLKLHLDGAATTMLACRKLNVSQVAEQVAWLTNVTLSIDHHPVRSGEMPQTFADTKAAEESISFKASVSLEDGIRRYLDWLQDSPTIFRTWMLSRR